MDSLCSENTQNTETKTHIRNIDKVQRSACIWITWATKSTFRSRIHQLKFQMAGASARHLMLVPVQAAAMSQETIKQTNWQEKEISKLLWENL